SRRVQHRHYHVVQDARGRQIEKRFVLVVLPGAARGEHRQQRGPRLHCFGRSTRALLRGDAAIDVLLICCVEQLFEVGCIRCGRRQHHCHQQRSHFATPTTCAATGLGCSLPSSLQKKAERSSKNEYATGTATRVSSSES